MQSPIKGSNDWVRANLRVQSWLRDASEIMAMERASVLAIA